MLTSGSMYTERFQVWLKFDTLTSDPRSKQVVTQIQWRFLWLDEPWGVSGFLQTGIGNWTMKELRKMPDWFDLHSQVYLGLMSEAEMKEKEM